MKWKFWIKVIKIIFVVCWFGIFVVVKIVLCVIFVNMINIYIVGVVVLYRFKVFVDRNSLMFSLLIKGKERCK